MVSKYEARWKRQEKTIWDLTISSVEDSKESELIGDFCFGEDYDLGYIKDNLPKKALIEDDHLVHFEALYDIVEGQEKGLLIKLTLGSFNKPVTKYILVANAKARYYQGEPIRTRSNLAAHQLIKKSLK